MITFYLWGHLEISLLHHRPRGGGATGWPTVAQIFFLAPLWKLEWSCLCSSHQAPLPFSKSFQRWWRNLTIISARSASSHGYIPSEPMDLHVLILPRQSLSLFKEREIFLSPDSLLHPGSGIFLEAILKLKMKQRKCSAFPAFQQPLFLGHPPHLAEGPHFSCSFFHYWCT